MKKYDLHSIMSAAWKFVRKLHITIAAALRIAWANAKIQNVAKAAAQITEEAHTWYGWKKRGYEVRHESKAIYTAATQDPATKSGMRVLSFFGASQVQPAAQQA